MYLKTLTNAIYGENTYVLSDGNEAVVIDCGCVTDRDKSNLQNALAGLKLVAVLNTHMHPDHICGNAFLEETYGVKPTCHRDDLFLAHNALHCAAQLGMPINPQPVPTDFLEDGDSVCFGNTSLKVIATPGHSPGCICFYSKEDAILISGDTLFQNSIGRSDLWEGNGPQLLESIKQKLYTLPPETKVYPGHGSDTTIGDEIKYNPYV